MTLQEAKRIFIDRGSIDGIFEGDKWREAVKTISDWLESEPVEDCISREEVCDYIAEFVNHEYATDREREMVKHIIDGIQHLSSIQPKTDVLDKIRAEIQGLRNCSCNCSDGIIDDVEDIIDKYKAESEDKE